MSAVDYTTRREYLSTIDLEKWANLNDIQHNGICIDTAGDDKGKRIVASSKVESSQNHDLLITVPPQLILSLETVWIYAKSDRHLLEVLEAVGDYSRTARGAILIFLLLQITHNASAESDRVSVSSPWTQYVRFVPPEENLPTFWSEEERALTAGTSLEAALDAKLRSLEREFINLSDSTLSIGWCQRHWWNTGTDGLSFDDWKAVDSMYRSRALDLPGTGHAMVPYIDMANHASGDETVALYETDPDGNAVLIRREGKTVNVGDEVTITYGDDKGVCEMLFSYGFIEDSMTSARGLFLDLEIPDDDPLKLAKTSTARSPPGFKLFESGGFVNWDGDFVWLICVNEEDGLDFRLLQTVDGERELKLFWKDQEIRPSSAFRDLLKEEQLWDVFQLRAVATLQSRVEQQLLALERAKASNHSMQEFHQASYPHINIIKLRDFEEKLMVQAYEDFEQKKNVLLTSQVVQDYLASANKEQEIPDEDDFT
ncbi:MAG: hypothetical protein Q9180_005354 [Flavoplaca navasiana]